MVVVADAVVDPTTVAWALAEVPTLHPPVPHAIVVTLVVFVDPKVVVFTPAPVPTFIVEVVASVASDTVPPFAVIPANVNVSVEPDPPNDNPVVPPVNVKLFPVRAPPVSPVIEIEEAAGAAHAGSKPVTAVNTCPVVPLAN